MPKAGIVPSLACSCGHKIEIPDKRIGDSVTCPACRESRVVLRSKVQGDVPGSSGAPGAVSDRLPELQESLARIRLRKAGAAARGIALYPVWATVASGVFGFWLPAVLAGQNLAALGDSERGRRLQVLGVTSYTVLGGALLVAWARSWTDLLPVPHQAKLAALVLAPLVGALAFGLVGRREIGAAFEAGAKPASPLVAGMIGFLLAMSQVFLVAFVDLATAR